MLEWMADVQAADADLSKEEVAEKIHNLVHESITASAYEFRREQLTMSIKLKMDDLNESTPKRVWRYEHLEAAGGYYGATYEYNPATSVILTVDRVKDFVSLAKASRPAGCGLVLVRPLCCVRE
jgi:hypothetical protein